MLKLTKSNLLIIALVAIATVSAAHAADGDLDGDLVESELGTADEAAPPPEYPYPGAKEEGIVTSTDSDEITTPPAATNASNAVVERPVRIDEETGDYYYPVKVEKATPLGRTGDHQPEDVKNNGEYEYSTKVTPPTFSGRPGVEAPNVITATGEFKYATEKSPTSATASFRIGFFGPPLLVNPRVNKTFQDIYTRDQLPVLFGDYEMPLTKKFGHIGLKFGSGLFVAQGKGVFVNPDPANRRPDDAPQEQYSFFMFPNQLTAQYRFQFADDQKIVPYVEGGAGYFTFVELRDDGAGPKIGGALTTVLAGGVNFQMDWLDPEALQRLDADYGINHVYLTTEFRQIVGLNSNYDFSSSVFNAGFLLQF